MSLAWKVMVPLGLVNLVLTAALVEYQKPLAAAFGTDSMLVPIIISWCVTLAAWMTAGLMAPLASDNRPQSVVNPFDAEEGLEA